MITYVTWHKDIDAAFRAFYPTVVFDEATGKGETVQDEPQATDTHYTIGTSRMTAQSMMALVAEFGDAISLEG
jgi:hypothetical protein